MAYNTGMQNDYQHIIWDWNGTLFDDAWLCLEIMNGMLEKRGLPSLSAERYATIFNFPVKHYYQQAGWDYDKVPFETLSDEFIREYEDRKLECSIRIGTLDVLKEFQQRGILQSVVSASKQSSLEHVLNYYGVGDFLVGAHGLEDHHARGKLSVGRRWVQELDIPPESILLVGDTIHDYELASYLGLSCVLITSGHQSRKRLAACNVPLIDSLDQLVEEQQK
jgi:phosphoglycolate phosphatase